MCMIMASREGIIPSVESLVSAKNQNSDGIGIAWRTANHAIEFRRGINMWQLCEYLLAIRKSKSEYVVHFRFATAGSESLACSQPIPIARDKRSLFARSGKCGAVIAHNGTWREWDTHPLAPDKLLSHGTDSMLIAYLAAIDKRIHLPRGDHRIAILTSSSGLTMLGQGWSDGKKGIYYSSQYFDTDYKEKKGWRTWKISTLSDANAVTLPYLRS